MDFEQLGESWRNQPLVGRDRDPAGEIRSVRERAEALDRAVRRRDRIETGVALALLPVFVWFAVTTSRPVSAVGAWILVAACIVTPLRLRAARTPRPEPGRPLAQGLRAELDRVRRQERLLGSVAWWYVGPSVLGSVLLVGGGSGSLAAKGLYGLAVIALGVWIVRLNRAAVRRNLAPVARTLDQWLTDLEAAPDAHPERTEMDPR